MKFFAALRENLKENLGLKIGVVTAASIFVVVMLLLGILAMVQVPLISKFTMLQVLFALAVVIAAFSILMIAISTNLFLHRPLSRLMAAIRQAESGDLKVKARVDTEDEIGQVASQFNAMLGKIHDLEGLKLETERKITSMQEELKFKAMLEEKAEIISSTNLKLEASLNELSMLYNISQALTGSIDPEELCNLLCDVIVRNVGIQDFAILLLDEETQKMEVKAARGFKRNDYVRELTFELGEGISGKVAKTRQPIYIPDTSKDSGYMHYKGAKTEDGSFLSLPIVAKGLILGAINFSRQEVNAFSEGEIRLLTTVAGQVAIALENARLYAKTKEMTLIDDLTKVYNRRHFQKILEMEVKRAKRFRRPLSLLMIDVDYFKRFNDTFGHLEGDHVLAELAASLADNLREVDTVARYGGEEFSVVLPNTAVEEARIVAFKLKDIVEKLHIRQGRPLNQQVTVSIGAAELDFDKDTPDEILNHADMALYGAKSQGRNCVVLHRKETALGLRAVE
ncbi:MAG TPA: diguanylate cyclase [bacterium]|nr:diguanylate cyclase [bacterium]